MEYAFRDRPLNPYELEVLRLVLSTFRDGGGQVVRKTGETMPGFRDFERGLAAVLHGKAPENKGIFDVIVTAAPKPFGISCKMSSMQPAANRCSFMELSNSAALFRQHLLLQQVNWATEPMLAGPAIVDLVSSWHFALGDEIDVESSKYAVLAHNARWDLFQLLAFPLNLKVANPKGDVEWLVEGKSLNGYMMDGDRRHRLWQCYMNSGGQLKYYPPLSWAEWVTEPFTLAKPPIGSPIEKARTYFGEIWPEE
jgi:hypothetical protein